MHRLESPDCPQMRILGVARRHFLLGLLIGAALCYGAMHVPLPAWLQPADVSPGAVPGGLMPSPAMPTGPLGDPSLPPSQ